MIELISANRCVECNKCVAVCPANVFDEIPGSQPVIARQEDCQTCFLCEAYCPADALYVDAHAHEVTGIAEEEVEAQELFGQYRRNLGWNKGNSPIHIHRELQELRKTVGSPY